MRTLRKYSMVLAGLAIAVGTVAYKAQSTNLADEVHGVLLKDDANSRYMITQGVADNNHCTNDPSRTCTIKFDPSVDIPYQIGTNWYVDYSGGVKVEKEGLYTAPPTN